MRQKGQMEEGYHPYILCRLQDNIMDHSDYVYTYYMLCNRYRHVPRIRKFFTW